MTVATELHSTEREEDGRRQVQLVGVPTCLRNWGRRGSSRHFGARLLVRQGWRFRRWPVDASTLALPRPRWRKEEQRRRREEERKEKANVQQKEEESLLGGPRLSTVPSVCPDLDVNLLEHYPFLIFLRLHAVRVLRSRSLLMTSSRFLARPDADCVHLVKCDLLSCGRLRSCSLLAVLTASIWSVRLLKVDGCFSSCSVHFLRERL